MNIETIEIAGIVVSLFFLIYFSAVEGAVLQSSALVLRAMMEKEDARHSSLFALVLEDRMQLLVPLHFGTQVSLITIAILVTHLSLNQWGALGVLNAFGVTFLISILFRQLLPRLLTQNAPERKLQWLLTSYEPLYPMMRSLALPLSSTLRLFKQLHDKEERAQNSAAEEASEEEIQAYLGIGEDEGILEEEDSKLIQSVVEFGDTLVREVMTPRTRIVGCGENSTVGDLRDVMVNHRHSRIPIYRDDIDHIVGIVYIHHLLAHLSRGSESDSISNLIRPALFVPETKRVSMLLKELQEKGDHTAIVIDEFGGVAGLVTIEDLVEEIVGEIRDEDQAKVSEIVEESPRSFIIRGATEIDRFEELVNKRFEPHPSSTVAGLIVSFLGRIPSPGEEFSFEGMQVEILDADRKRIHKLRLQLPPETPS